MASTVVGFAVIASAVSGCGSVAGCDLDSVLRSRAGRGAVDCGHVAAGASTTETDDCIAAQTEAGVPFYAHYDAQGIDSRVAYGVVRDPSGRTSVLFWDSDPSGGAGAGARVTESVCSGQPPVQTQQTGGPAVPIVGCTVETSTDLVCGG
jgi:hypothetical protein